jgi:CubicO group peptidase (beta-lactamase class C family)
LQGCKELANLGYEHDARIVGRERPSPVALPAVHRVASLLKRWLLGTHNGGRHEAARAQAHEGLLEERDHRPTEAQEALVGAATTAAQRPFKPYSRLEMISSSGIAEAVRAVDYAADTPLAIGVSRGDREPLFFAQGAGLDGGAFGVASVAYAASLAKQITGACAALLALGGALDPDALIAEWMPEFPPWRERVRVRHLIHHTAGLPDVWPQMQKSGESDWTSHGVLAALADTPQLDSEPGSTYAYTGVGYICLAAIVERIAGSPFSEFARVHIFEPLQMKSSIFWTGPSAAPPNAAVVPEPASPAPLAKLIRLPDSSASFAVLAAHSSVERMVALGDLLQASLIQHALATL